MDLQPLPKAVQTTPPPPGAPAGAGVYYQQAPAAWIKLDPAFMDSSELKGLNVFLQTEGLAGLNVSFTFLAAEAALQIGEHRPVFYVRGIGSAQSALIVRLTKKRHTRTVQTISSAATAENKAGFRKGDTHKVSLTLYSDGSFSATPLEDLKRGEYILAFGNANQAFDFGISPQKK